MGESEGPGMESVRNITGALTAIHSAEEAVKTIRTSWSILRCFLFFDICYLMSSVTLIVMALTSDKENSEMILFGGAFGILPRFLRCATAWLVTVCAAGGDLSSSPG